VRHMDMDISLMSDVLQATVLQRYLLAKVSNSSS
jgi:hypothetical protein